MHPVEPGRGALPARIARCEAFYRTRGQRPVFKLTEAAQPEGLDAALEARGYAHADPTCVEVLDLPAASAGAMPRALVVEDRPSAGWIERCLSLRDLDGARVDAFRGILDRLVARCEACAFATLPAGPDGHAQGLAVLSGGAVVLEEIATAPAARRRGLAREVVRGLLAWAAERGAARAVLQVVAANAPARGLYTQLGFVERYRYWYREAP